MLANLWLLASVCLLIVPGALILALLGVRSWLVRIGGAAPVSIGFFQIVAILAALFHIRFTLATVCAFLLAIILLTALIWSRGGTLKSRLMPHRPPLSVAFVTESFVLVCAIGLGVWTWLGGTGGLSTVLQEHDVIQHVAATAYIADSGDAAPWQLMPANVVSGEPVSYYPAAFMATAALLTNLGADVVTALNASLVAVAAVAAPLGIATLSARLPRVGGVSSGPWSALALVVAYRPTIALVHDGGILPSLVAYLLLPAALALFTQLGRTPVRASLAAGIGAAGVFLTHPSGGVALAISILAWFAGASVFSTDRRELGKNPMNWGKSVAYSALGALPALAGVFAGIGNLSSTGAWPRDFAVKSINDAIGIATMAPYLGFLDPEGSMNQVFWAVLAFVGAVVILATRRGLPALSVAGFWVLATVVYLTGHTGLPWNNLFGVFYNSYVRISAPITIFGAMLCGIAMAALTGGICILWLRITPIIRHTDAPLRAGDHASLATSIALLIATLLALAVSAPKAVQYALVNQKALQSRYSHPDFVRVNQDDLAAFHFLESHDTDNKLVLNTANDGSTYLYAYTGVPVLNFNAFGSQTQPCSYELLADIDELDHDLNVQKCVDDLNIGWIYVDTSAPGIGTSNNAPERWYTDQTFTLPPAFLRLDSVSSVVAAFHQGTVTVYQIVQSSGS